MKAQKNGLLAWKERNRNCLDELGIAENKSALGKLGAIFTMPAGGTTKKESDSDLATHVATACAASFLRRAQVLQ